MVKKENKLPVLPIKDPRLVIFPGVPCSVDIGRSISVDAVSVAKSKNTNIIVALQRDPQIDDPTAKDFYDVCVEAEIKSFVSMDENGSKRRVVILGIHRAILKTISKVAKGEQKYLIAEFVPYIDANEIDDDTNKSIKVVKGIVEKYFSYINLKSVVMPKDGKTLSMFVDSIVGQIRIEDAIKLEVLLEKDSKKRLYVLVGVLSEAVKQIKQEPQRTAGAQVEDSEVADLRKAIDDANMPEEIKKVALQEFKRLKNMNSAQAEYSVIENYIETLTSLPWDKKTEDKLDVEEAKKVLERDHYGLEKVKERILEFLAVRKLAPDKKGAILCFKGPPGTGKTSISKSIAESMNRKFVRMSLGGVRDEAEIRGHRKTYIGAMTGRVIQHLKNIGVNNPVFCLDEVDKLSKDYRGDPASALLEVLDPEQNNAFVDNYLNVPFDLSNVFFIATVNELDPIPAALRDRMEIVEIPGYSPDDKLHIAQKHLVPKQKEVNGLKDKDISFSTASLTKIIEEYTSEAGVRSLERECGSVLRKIAVLVASGKEPPSIIRADSVPKFLGPPKIFAEKMLENPEVGISTGLAWSQHGGSLLFIETSLYPGKGEIKLTGNLGKVIQESAMAVHTWIRSNADKLGINNDYINTHDVHIHFPAGAIPKDGPSAGVSIATSMVSAFTGKLVRNNIAMTGEISLRGRVMPIGGLTEKVLAAHRAGIREVLYPIQNGCNIEEIPQDIRNDMVLTPISTITEVISRMLVSPYKEEVNVKENLSTIAT